MKFESALPYREDASAYFSALRDLPWAAWLDSGGCGRFDVLVAQPVATLVCKEGTTQITKETVQQNSREDPFQLLRMELGTVEAPLQDVPFAGGALGYWGYDLAINQLPIPKHSRNTGIPADMAVGIYDWAVVIDHQQRHARLLSRQRYQQTAAELPHILQRLNTTAPAIHGARNFRVLGEIESNLDQKTYRHAFEAIQRFLHEGDCYQVNLAQRFAAKADGDAFMAYLELRSLSPAPYAGFLDWPELQVLCASPELFLQVRQGCVTTRPIKGTRPRSTDAAADASAAYELSQHAKDRAENLMIVDLLRNDISKSCIAGTVRTPKLFEVESFSNVHHLVSTVQGRLREGSHALDLLRDCFPGGSITGAPKRRAMEIIEDLETQRREIYCGAIGYVGFDGNMQTNIAIRTMVYLHGEIRCWAGGGIVADSVCADEYQETMDKASAMLAIMQKFGGRIKRG